MVDKKSYDLLKKLYKVEHMTAEEVSKFTGIKIGCYNPHTDYLSKENLAEYGITGEHDAYRITLKGRAYVEDQRQKKWGFWLPYGITTSIAVLNLIVLLIDFLSRNTSAQIP